MFTFKKIALLGTAALAAFSISCSDEDDPSGKIEGLTITDSDAGIMLAGTITANGDIKVKSVAATADGTAIKILGSDGEPINADGKTSVSLAGAFLSGVCASKTGEITPQIVITVTFSDETNISEKKKVNVDCGGGSSVPEGSYVVSSAEYSYLDVDGPHQYKVGDLTDSNKDKVDLVGYHTSAGATGDNIWNPCNVTSIGGAKCGDARIFKTEAALRAGQDDDDDLGEEKIALSQGATFYLESSELDAFKVSVTALIAGKSVTLKVEAID